MALPNATSRGPACSIGRGWGGAAVRKLRHSGWAAGRHHCPPAGCGSRPSVTYCCSTRSTVSTIACMSRWVGVAVCTHARQRMGLGCRLPVLGMQPHACTYPPNTSTHPTCVCASTSMFTSSPSPLIPATVTLQGRAGQGRGAGKVGRRGRAGPQAPASAGGGTPRPTHSQDSRRLPAAAPQPPCPHHLPPPAPHRSVSGMR